MAAQILDQSALHQSCLSEAPLMQLSQLMYSPSTFGDGTIQHPEILNHGSSIFAAIAALENKYR